MLRCCLSVWLPWLIVVILGSHMAGTPFPPHHHHPLLQPVACAMSRVNIGACLTVDNNNNSNSHEQLAAATIQHLNVCACLELILIAWSVVLMLMFQLIFISSTRYALGLH